MRIQINRLIRHRFAKTWHTSIPEEGMQRLTDLVASSEKLHSGEIRICIESRLPNRYLLQSQPMRSITRQRALAQFSKLRVWDTEHNNGVLIYLLLPERAIELVADRGIHARVAPDAWQAIVRGLSGHLQHGRFEEGLRQAVAGVSALLSVQFPLDPSQKNPNELPDRPSVNGDPSA